MPGTGSVNGLVSGLDTSAIITKMIAMAQQPQAKLQADKVEAQNKLATWQDLNTRVLAFKTKADSLAVSGAFTQCNANSTNMSVVQAVAGTSATPGTYYLTVKSRAQSHQVAAMAKGATPTAFTSATDDVGTGKLSFEFDADSTKNFDVTLDATNNTLTGLRDAINKANKGMQASIVNSGSAMSPAYQLVLSTTDTGAASEFTVDNADGGVKIDFSTVIQKGSDAEITLGGGGAGTTPISVSKNTNSFDDLIPGVTLNILNPDKDATVKIEVARNTGVIKNSIQDFVQSYNDLADAIGQQSTYDSTSKQGGVLLGNWDLQSVQMTLSSIANSVIPGLDKHFSALATIGITQDTAGHLVIDDAALTKAVSDNLTDVSNLFSSSMTSDSSGISFVNATSDTHASPAAGWDVNITQAARQAQVTAGAAMKNALGADETLNIALASDSTKNKAITLKKDWTLSQVVTEINKYSDQTGASAVATDANGVVNADSSQNTYLTLRSTRYGKVSDVRVYSSLASGTDENTTGIGSKAVSAKDAESAAGDSGNGHFLAGLDVEGTINGEACTGTGQALTVTSLAANSTAKGLTLLIGSTAPTSSKVHFTKGLATSLRDTIISMTSSGGAFKNAQDALTKQMTDLDDTIASMQVSLDAQQEKLYAQFNAMESQMGQLQSQGNYLTQQFAAMNKSTG